MTEIKNKKNINELSENSFVLYVEHSESTTLVQLAAFLERIGERQNPCIAYTTWDLDELDEFANSTLSEYIAEVSDYHPGGIYYDESCGDSIKRANQYLLDYAGNELGEYKIFEFGKDEQVETIASLPDGIYVFIQER